MRKAGYARPVVVMLVLLNVLLASLMVYEVLALQQQGGSVSVDVATSVEQPIFTRNKTVVVRSIEDYAEIVNRPLFVKERRPLEQDETEVSEEEAQAFTLVGVVLTPEQQMAIIYSENQKQTVKVPQWERIDGWRLISVQANMVELRKAKRTLELALQRASQSGAKK